MLTAQNELCAGNGYKPGILQNSSLSISTPPVMETVPTADALSPEYLLPSSPAASTTLSPAQMAGSTQLETSSLAAPPAIAAKADPIKDALVKALEEARSVCWQCFQIAQKRAIETGIPVNEEQFGLPIIEAALRLAKGPQS